MLQYVQNTGVFSLTKPLSGFLLMILMAACEATPHNLVDEGDVQIKTEEAETISIVHVSIISENNEVFLSGEAIASRWYIVAAERGHIDFDVAYLNGNRIKKRGIKLRRRSGVSHGPRRLYFRAKLAREPRSGTKIRVFYHAGNHEPELNDAYH